MDADVEPHSEIVCELGEGPLWHAAAGRIYWHDVIRRRLHSTDRQGAAAATVSLEKIPGCFAFRAGGGLIAASRNQLALLDPITGEADEITSHGIDFGGERFNDGAVDTRGRFWAGTFDPGLKADTGGLYRIDPDFSVHRMDRGIAMSNGLAWSPDGSVLYFADSRPGQIYRYAFDMEAGTLGPRELFLDYADRIGRPDGCTTDADGFLWVAEVTAGRVARYTPEARLAGTLSLPVSKPTSLTFGGEDFTTLFVTSMRYGLDDEALAREPLAGRLLRAEVDVAGHPESLFGG